MPRLSGCGVEAVDVHHLCASPLCITFVLPLCASPLCITFVHHLCASPLQHLLLAVLPHPHPDVPADCGLTPLLPYLLTVFCACGQRWGVGALTETVHPPTQSPQRAPLVRKENRTTTKFSWDATSLPQAGGVWGGDTNAQWRRDRELTVQLLSDRPVLCSAPAAAAHQ